MGLKRRWGQVRLDLAGERAAAALEEEPDVAAGEVEGS